MKLHDLIGLAVIAFILLACLYGLYRISKPVFYTKEEYEERMKKGSGIARGAMNALMYPFEELIHPKAVEAVRVKRDMKAGYYNAQQENGDGLDDHESLAAEHKEIPQYTGNKNRVGLLRLFLNVFRFRR